MRILLVKLSSLGDVIHNLPVASDLARAFPSASIDWTVETPYASIAAMHPAISQVLPVPLRHLKKHWWSGAAWSAFLVSRSRLRGEQYDTILDTQGLLKSAWIANWPRGTVSGYANVSAREPTAARFYNRTYEVSRELHAVERNRLLAARAFGYAIDTMPNYGIVLDEPPIKPDPPYVVCLHATSRRDKMWPDEHWCRLGQRLQEAGLRVILPWGSAREKETSLRLANQLPNAHVPDTLSIPEMATLLAGAASVVGVDTGLAHLSVALGRPTIGIYVTTNPRLTGLYGGDRAINLGGGNADQPMVPDVDTVWDCLQPWLGGTQ